MMAGGGAAHGKLLNSPAAASTWQGAAPPAVRGRAAAAPPPAGRGLTGWRNSRSAPGAEGRSLRNDSSGSTRRSTHCASLYK